MDYNQAYVAASGHVERVRKHVKDAKKKKTKKVLRYYGIRLDPSFGLDEVLKNTFTGQPAATRRMWDLLVSTGRIDHHKAIGWHVTVCMVRNDDEELSKKCQDYATRIATYVDTHPRDASTSCSSSGSTLLPPDDRTEPGIPVTIHLKEVVWDDRIMAVVVDRLPNDIETANKVPHVTVATVSDDIKPVTSNEVLGWMYGGDGAAAARENSLVGQLSLDERGLEVKGELCAFYY